MDFLSKFFNIDYNKFYAFFKKMPAILSIATALLMVIGSFVDVSNSYTYDTITYYGFSQSRSAIAVLLAWWIVGAIMALVTWFFTALAVSPTIVRTDAVLEINEKTIKTND